MSEFVEQVKGRARQAIAQAKRAVASAAPESRKLTAEEDPSRPLVEKVRWHSGYNRIQEPPFSAEQVLQGAEVGKLRSPEGTTAQSLSSPAVSGEAHQHLSGRFKGYIFGVKGGIHDYYQKAGGVSRLGLPISDEYEIPGGWRHDFEKGSVVANKKPWQVKVAAPHNEYQAAILAFWSANDLKKVSEPLGDSQTAAPSRFGTEGVYMEFRDVALPNLRHGIIKHLTGPDKHQIIYLGRWDWDYYLTLGGTRSDLGFPLPEPKTETPTQSTIKFEGGCIIWTLQNGFSYKIDKK